MDGDGIWNAAAASWLALPEQDARLSAPLAGSQVEVEREDRVGLHRRYPAGAVSRQMPNPAGDRLNRSLSPQKPRAK